MARSAVMKRIRLAVVLTIGMLALGSCGDDDHGPYTIVGGACLDDYDCLPGVECERGGSFPDGTCTLPCRTHRDCPNGTSCVNAAGGVCLVSCASDLHCRPRYSCKARDNRGDRGVSLVCIR
jgi:hypothetical protein